MGKTSTAVKNKYNTKVYDQLAIRVPKGRRAEIEAFTREHGESINGMVNRLIQTEMGLSDDEWGGEPKMRTLAQLRKTLGEHGYKLQKKQRGQDSWCICESGTDIHVAGFDGGWDAPGLTIDEVQTMVQDEFWH